MMPEKLVADGGIEALAAELDEYREWISKNALYLAGDSKIKMNMFFYYAFKKGKKYADKEWLKTMNVKEETAELSRRWRKRFKKLFTVGGISFSISVDWVEDSFHYIIIQKFYFWYKG